MKDIKDLIVMTIQAVVGIGLLDMVLIAQSNDTNQMAFIVIGIIFTVIIASFICKIWWIELKD